MKRKKGKASEEELLNLSGSLISEVHETLVATPTVRLRHELSSVAPNALCHNGTDNHRTKVALHLLRNASKFRLTRRGKNPS